MNERAIFLAALDIANSAERAAYLNRACEGNSMLRQQVESLLAAHERSDEFLDVPALQQVAANAAPPADHPRVPGAETSAENQAGNGGIDLSFLQPSTKPGSLGRLGHYEIDEVIGRGGFGIVLKAFDERLERVVAIKVMAPELAATSPARKRFLREARAAAAIRHENVIAIHAVEDHPIPFLVMEYIAGQTLQQKLDETGPLEVPEILLIGQQIAEGLEAAHALGLIHRDIKPANVLLEKGRNRIKITDFGLARTADDASVTQSGTIAGTPLYMSPEQSLGEVIDPRSDLFSLGSVLYVMCSGRPPFRAPTAMAVLLRVATDPPRPIREIIPEAPDWLVAIIAKLHAKKPADRFASAKEVADLLGRCLLEFQQKGRVESVGNLLPLSPKPDTSAEKPVQDETKTSEKKGADASASRPARPRSRRWAAAAAIIGILVAGLGLTEATGVTNVHSTVIRLFSPDGTLVVEVDDPGVSVSIDGEEMVITGTGAKEIRLKPGQYKVLASKDGKVVRQEIVTVTRDGRQVVRVSKEAPPMTAVGGADPDGGVIEPKTSTVITPDIASQPVTQKPGEPVSNLALVRQPKALPGLRSWTIETIANRGGPCRVAFRPDSRQFVTAGGDGTLRIYDVGNDHPRRVLVGHSINIHYIAAVWSPDGKYLASASHDRTLRFWEPQTGQLLRTVVAPGNLEALAWSPDGTMVACTSVYQPTAPQHVIGVWSVADGKMLKSIPLVQGNPGTLAWSRDSKRLAGTLSGKVSLWDLASGQIVQNLLGDQENQIFGDIIISPDGQRLAASSGKDVCVWELSTSRKLAKLEHTVAYLSAFGWSPDSQQLLSWEYGGKRRVWDAGTGKVVREIPGGFLNRGVFAPDGRTVSSQDTLGNLEILDFETGKAYGKRLRSADPANSVSWSPTGDRFAVGHGYSGATIWEATSGRMLRRLDGSRGGHLFPCWSPTGKVLATSSGLHGRVVLLWDPDTGNKLATLEGHTEGGIHSAWSHDGRFLATGGWDKTVRIWTADGKQLHTLKEHTGEIRVLAWSPDGAVLASAGTDSTIRLWDAVSGKPLAVLEEHKDAVNNLAWSPDGKTLVSLGDQRTLYWWDPVKGSVRHKASTYFPHCIGLAWSPDGKFVAADARTVIRIFDGETAKMVREMTLDYHYLHFLAFTPKGDTLLAPCGNGVQVLDVASGQRRAVVLGLQGEQHLAISSDGHWRGSPGIEKQLVYIAVTDAGQEMLTYDEFCRKYGWKNEPDRVNLTCQSRFTNSLGMEFALVPKGKSWLGGRGGKPGDKQVEFKEDLYLGVYEVTQGEWEKVMGKNPSHFSRTGAGKLAVKDLADADLKQLPVETICWDDCQEFIARLNEKVKEPGWVYRLPTEAEWEYACRGGPLADRLESAFDFYVEKPTNQLQPQQANFKHPSSPNRPCKVGSYPPNRLGLHDMHGNVWEWCEDILEKNLPDRVHRGGSFGLDAHGFPMGCQAACRGGQPPWHRSIVFGLRVARVRTP
jgi:WD40 repeat protein